MLPKITSEIWQFFTRALGLKIESLMTSFCIKSKMYEIKIYRGVMCHDNEEWCKTWRGIDLPVQNWHEEFDKFWPEQLKISKICTLMDCFWPKHIMFELKKVKRSYVWWHWIVMQNLKETDSCFQKRHEEFSKFSPEHVRTSKNWDFDGILLSKVENVWA